MAAEPWKLFRPTACSVELVGASREEVFGELVENFVKAKCLAAAQQRAALKALLEREAMASTGVGQKVAIPHVKLPGLEEALFSLSLHRTGIDWAAIDGQPVTIFFTVLRPEKASARHDPERHLEMMRWISQLARDADFRRFAQAVESKKALVDLLREKSPS